jgi:general secretion pathway protein I
MSVLRPMRQRGFSLLEMLVAVAILGLTLGALYQATAGATRNIRTDERYAYAVELARSLLAANSSVPRDGFREGGETAGGFLWEVTATPLTRPRGSRFADGGLQALEITVAWADGPGQRRVRLHSVIPGAGP